MNTEHRSGVSYAKIEELPMIDSNFLYGTTQRRLPPPSCQFQLRVDIASCVVPLLNGAAARRSKISFRALNENIRFAPGKKLH